MRAVRMMAVRVVAVRVVAVIVAPSSTASLFLTIWMAARERLEGRVVAFVTFGNARLVVIRKKKVFQRPARGFVKRIVAARATFL